MLSDKKAPLMLTSFKDVASMWLNRERNPIARTTRDRYETILELYILPYIGESCLQDITEEMIDSLLEKVSSDTANKGKDGGSLKGNSLVLIRDITRRIITFAKDNDGGREKFEIPVSKAGVFLPLSVKELEKICRCAKANHSREMLGVLLMIFMGIRTGEVCALSCDDVHLLSREIYIHRSVHRVKVKGERNDPEEKRTENSISELPLKSQIRMEPIPEALLSYIEDFFIPGTILLTGDKNNPLEPKTFRNRVNKTFEPYRIGDIPFQRYRKTYTEGKADISILEAVLSGRKRDISGYIDNRYGITNNAKMNIVVDTNVVVSGLKGDMGNPHKLLEELQGGKFDISVSVPLVLEYEAQLKKYLSPEFFSADDIDDFIDYICRIGHKPPVYFFQRPFLKDPFEDHVLELAVASHSRYIVTMNKMDFTDTGHYGIEIVSPGEFLDILGEPVAEKLTAIDNEKYIEDRASRGSEAKYLKVLKKVPHVQSGQDDPING